MVYALNRRVCRSVHGTAVRSLQCLQSAHVIEVVVGYENGAQAQPPRKQRRLYRRRVARVHDQGRVVAVFQDPDIVVRKRRYAVYSRHGVIIL